MYDVITFKYGHFGSVEQFYDHQMTAHGAWFSKDTLMRGIGSP